MSKNTKFSDFIKKNAYYLAFVLCLSVLVVITVALIVTGNQKTLDVGGNGTQIEEEDKNQNQGGDQTGGEDQGSNENQGGNNQPDGETQKPETPTPTVIIFEMPIKNAEIIKDYVSASVIYNQTLGVYSGHKAIDFSAPEGTEVVCAYDGVIESIEISKVKGTSVIVNHGNGLKTVYNSIEASDLLNEGASVSKGEVLGTVSLNNKTEYLDGAHLHFEVIENNVKVDPNKYLPSEGK